MTTPATTPPPTPATTPAPTGRPTGLPHAEAPAGEPMKTMDERHAAFVEEHVLVEPDQLPEGAAQEVEAVVEHLHAVVEVLDVIETAAAEGRAPTKEELERLEEPQAVLDASTFGDPEEHLH